MSVNTSAANNGLLLTPLPPGADINSAHSNHINNNNRLHIHINNHSNGNTNEFVRDVHKAGWLRYLPYGADRPSTSSSTAPGAEEHRFWTIFSIHNDTQPYIEFYQKRQLTPTTGQTPDPQSAPVSTHSLQRCQHVAPAIGLSTGDKAFNEFAITLDTYIIRLVADSQHSMCDWIDSLRSKLRQLDVLPARDNLYMREPQPLPRQNSVTNRHNHFRPLPPIPMPPNGIGSPSNISLATTPTRRAGPGTPGTPLTPLSPLAPIATVSSANTPTTSALPLPPLARAETPTEIYETIFDGQQQHRQTQQQQQLPAQPPLPARTLHSSQSLAMSASAPISSPSGATLEPLNSHVPAEEGPPPYELIAATSSAPVSLRESQVLRLRKEIAHPSGVRLMVRKKDCYHSIALVDMGDGVWLAGWRQKEFPVLHNTFHIGDRLLSINGDPVTTASQAYKLIKQHQLVLEIIVRRVPYGRVFCIKRQREGQDLGLVRDGNKAEIVAVVTGGLADKAGLNSRAEYGDGECNWCLTEVNNRALSMFFKGQEVRERLQAVGKEISILVQPMIFVKHLKKQLKQFRNFKDYIVQ